MSDYITISMHLEWNGLTLDGFGWPEQRAFYDAVIPALVSMQDGLSAKDIVPISVTGGSARPSMRAPERARVAMERLRVGPTADWSPKQRRKAARLWTYLEHRGATLDMGHGRLERVHAPAHSLDWRVRELTTLTAEVLRVGGENGTVEVRFRGDGHRHCQAGRALARELAGQLYKRVTLYGLAERDPTTHLLLNFSIRGFEPSPAVQPGGSLTKLHDLIGDSMDDFDPIEHLRLLRG